MNEQVVEEEDDQFGDIAYVHREIEKPDVKKVEDGTRPVKFVNPVVVVGIMDYLMAADLLMNIEYRVERVIKFGKQAMEHIRDKWNVPEPYNMGVFAAVSLISIYIAQKILGRIMGGRGKASQNYKFNTPDLAEIGVLVNNVKKLHEDVSDIKKALTS